MENNEKVNNENTKTPTPNDYVSARINMWKHIWIAFFWCVLTLSVAVMFVNYAFHLMSHGGSFAFFFGILLLGICTLSVFFILDFQFYKLKVINNAKKFIDKVDYNDNNDNNNNNNNK